ncbi:hypothetical protein EVA_22684, partial [gut metagenome]
HLYSRRVQRITTRGKRQLCAVRWSANSGADAGFASAYSIYAPSETDACFGSRLCFKNSALAKYAGNQFFEIYKDF